jgi:calcium/calmodulin-dependent protein kinase I
LLPEIRAYVTKARLRRGIEKVKLANRIEALKMQEDEEEDTPGDADVPANAMETVGDELAAKNFDKALNISEDKTKPASGGSKLSRLARGAIFREIVLAKVREEKEQQMQKEFEEKKLAEKRRSSSK